MAYYGFVDAGGGGGGGCVNPQRFLQSLHFQLIYI